MTPNEKPASPTQGETDIRQVIFDALDLSEELRIECTTDVVNALEAAGFLSALDRTTLPQGIGLICEYASDGCGKQATVRFERGGVGSYYCHDCYMRIQAIPAGRLALTSGRERE